MSLPRDPALALAALGITILVGVGGLAAAVGTDGRILPNTAVDGVTVGRLRPAEAVRVLAEARAEGRLRPVPADVVVTTPDGVTTLSTSDLGLRHDLEASVARAAARGRSGRPGDVTVRIASLRRRADVASVLAADPTATRAAVDALAARLDRAADLGELRVDPQGLGVVVIAPRTGVTVRREESVARLLAALAVGSRSSVTLAADVVPAPAPTAAIEALAEQLRTALDAGLVVTRDGRSVTVARSELAAAVRIGASTDGAGRPVPVLRLDPVVLARGPGARIAATFERAAVDAELLVPPAVATFSDLGSTSFTATPADVRLDLGRTELRFGMELTARQLERMIAAGRTSERVDLRELPAARPPSAFTRHRLPTHVIGTFTTFHPAGAPRTVNIRRLADTLDGTLVAPGEEFSTNGASGPRRCDDGYVLAGTIVRGELIDTCGGGVSQLGTTAYNAAFFAGLPTTAWQPHSFFISRYPMGREATLSYPDLDVRFVNDTPGWIAIRTAHTPTSVTVTLYGVPVWAEVRAVHSEPRDARPFPTEFRAAPDLAPGRERIVQTGGGGFTVDVSRVRVPRTGGEPLTERTRTVYRPQTRIVEVGVPAPAPNPLGGSTTAASGAGAG
jgi:hypothetical protein